MRLVLLGPPGVGKGTQGRRLAADRTWALISTGEILREAVARGTEMGREAGRRMAVGHLVPDDVMIGLVQDRILEPDAANGFVLDGFPRTVPQAEALDAMLKQRGQVIDAAVSLAAPAEELVNRLTARRECPVCKRAYNRITAPPAVADRCDDHPDTALIQRADDTESTIRTRLGVYREQTEPLMGYFRSQGRLIEVLGTGSPQHVYEAMRQAIEASVGGR